MDEFTSGAFLPSFFPIWKSFPQPKETESPSSDNEEEEIESEKVELNSTERLDLNRIMHEEIGPVFDLSVDGAKGLGHCIMMQLWYLVLKSEVFQPKKEFEKEVILLEDFVIKRQHEYSNQIFGDLLFYDDSLRNSSGESQPKKRKTKKKETNQPVARSYLSGLIPACLKGELPRCVEERLDVMFSKEEETILDFDTIKEAVLKFFTFRPPSNLNNFNLDDVILIFTTILDYIMYEVLTGSFTFAEQINSTFLVPAVLQKAIHLDEDLASTLFNHINFVPMVDVRYFCGYNSKIESMNWSGTIHKDIVIEILSKFDSLSSLMQMRLVCKNWNDIILRIPLIWKHLCRNVMVREALFSICDSSLSVEELEETLKREKQETPNTELLKYLLDNNDWQGIYFSVVHKHLAFVKDTEKFVEVGFKWIPDAADQSLSYSELDDLFKTSTTKLRLGARYDPQSELNRIQSIDSIMIPKSHVEDFRNVGSNYTYIGMMSFSDLSSLISCRNFPRNGILYCFYDFMTNKGLTLYYEETDFIKFKLEDTTFQATRGYITLPQSYFDSVMVNAAPSHPLFWMQSPLLDSRCHGFPGYAFLKSFHKTLPDDICLISDTIYMPSEEDQEESTRWTFSVFISPTDLKKRNFSKTNILMVPHYEQFMEM